MRFNRRQNAVYWPFEEYDEFGQPTVGSPIEIKVRKEMLREDTLNPRGELVRSSIRFSVDREMPLGGYLKEGTLASLPDTVTDAFQIIEYEETPTLLARQKDRWVQCKYATGVTLSAVVITTDPPDLGYPLPDGVVVVPPIFPVPPTAPDPIEPEDPPVGVVGVVDPLRELAGHPEADTTDWTWGTSPTWYTDASGNLGVQSTTGYKGAALIGETKVDVSYTVIAGGEYHKFRLGVGLPGTTRFNYEIFVDDVSVDSGIVYGQVGLYGDPTEITVDLHDYNVSAGEVIKFQCWCDRSAAEGTIQTNELEKYGVWQYSEFENAASATTYNANDIWISGAGNNSTGAAGSPSTAYKTVDYVTGNNDQTGVTITNGADANNKTVIWVERGYIYTMEGNRRSFWLWDLKDVEVRPYGSGEAPVIDGENQFPKSSIHWPTNPSGTTSGQVALLETENCIRCGFINIRVKQSASVGIFLRSTGNPAHSQAGSSTDNYVKYCYVDETASDGIMAGAMNIDPDPDPVYEQNPLIEYCTTYNTNYARNVLSGGATGQAITFTKTDGGIIRGCKVRDAYKECIDIIASDNWIVELNEVGDSNPSTNYANRIAGIYTDGTHVGITTGIIRRNIVYGVHTGIKVGNEGNSTVDGVTVENNLIYNVRGNCISHTGVLSTSNNINTKFYNNTCIGTAAETNTQFLFTSTISGTSSGHEMKGNIFYRPGAGAYQFLINSNIGWSSYTRDKNLFWNGTRAIRDTAATMGDNAIEADPDFETNSALGSWPFETDYYPSSSSPALGVITGTELVTNDLINTTRSVPHDLGCFERS